MVDFRYEGFDELEKYGFVDEYVSIDHSQNPPVIKPTSTVEGLLAKGFKPKGTKLRFLNANGYDAERERAATIFDQQKEYTVKLCRVGRSSSSYEFEEVEGAWNTVMFGVGKTIVQRLDWMIETWSKNGLNVEKLKEERDEYKDVSEFLLTQHLGTITGSYMTDQYVCSCGWQSAPYWDGAEYASKDWHQHVYNALLREPEWPIKKEK